MRALAMVAHPDDCIIFAYSFMHHHPGLCWDITYLTYTDDQPRAREMQKFWAQRDVRTTFLGYVDDFHDLESGCCSFDINQAKQDIIQQIHEYDLVLTHNLQGEYGHPHHKFVHESVINNHSQVVVFADQPEGNLKYTMEKGVYDFDDFPLHKDVVFGFHGQEHYNWYYVPDKIKSMLGITQ